MFWKTTILNKKFPEFRTSYRARRICFGNLWLSSFQIREKLNGFLKKKINKMILKFFLFLMQCWVQKLLTAAPSGGSKTSLIIFSCFHDQLKLSLIKIGWDLAKLQLLNFLLFLSSLEFLLELFLSLLLSFLLNIFLKFLFNYSLNFLLNLLLKLLLKFLMNFLLNFVLNFILNLP